jgi:CBS domain-containing protein
MPVYSMIFSVFAIPARYQHRVLMYGIIGALIMRGAFIVSGAALLNAFHLTVYLFGALLICAAVKLSLQRQIDPSRTVLLRLLSRVIPTDRQSGMIEVPSCGSEYAWHGDRLEMASTSTTHAGYPDSTSDGCHRNTAQSGAASGNCTRRSVAMTTQVADVMTTDTAVVPEAARYKEIVATLRRHGVSSAPVLDRAGRVVGVVSEADLLDRQTTRELPSGTIRLAWKLRQWSRAAAATAADLMTAPAVTVSPEQPIAEAARLMESRRLRRLPVTDAQGRLAGVVSRADVLSVAERPDEHVRHDVMTKVIAGRFGLSPRAFDVTVNSGLVTIAGCVDDQPTAIRLIGSVWQVEGVCGVRDRLLYLTHEPLEACPA